MPAGVQTGDLIIVAFGLRGNLADGVTHTGYTQIARQDAASQSCTTLYRVATGADTLTVTTTAATESGHVTYRLSGWHGTTPPEGTMNTISLATTTPDPPSETASWGSADNLWIAGFCRLGDDSDPLVSVPTGFASFRYGSGGTTGDMAAATATNPEATATLDPDVFTMTDSIAGFTFTLAVRPSAVVQSNAPRAMHHYRMRQ